MSSDTESENNIIPNVEDSKVEDLVTKVRDMELNENFINIKIGENFNINDTPSTSKDKNIPIRNESQRSPLGYAVIKSTMKQEDNYKPY